ncbi:DUF2683 family protein [Olivibacter sitiensis]|uniref:DUF2683 family protein n=1 Tax=Olivibacter sitiensis TaxID=376470 RepID=UPI00042870A9|nr:DUF2683 family protein [Olivibacter sitiensis]
METILIHPNNKEQLAAVKAFARALKMSFEVKSVKDDMFMDELRKAVEEVKLIKQGKLKGKPVEDLLNEL